MIIVGRGGMSTKTYRTEINIKSCAGHGASAVLFYDFVVETR